jgi:RecG-like helicase
VGDAVRRRERALVLFPVEQGTGADVLDLRDAARVVKALEAQALAGFRLALFHGAMPREERYRTFDDYRHTRSDVLVSTSRLEDSLVPCGARVAVLEQADRVDVGRLLRIRAMLGGGTLHLVAGELPDEAGLERIRGLAAGDTLVGIPSDATGALTLPRLRQLDLERDAEVVLQARLEVGRILHHDPSLRLPQNAEYVRMVRNAWAATWAEGEGPPMPIRDGGGGNRRRRRRRKKK